MRPTPLVAFASALLAAFVSVPSTLSAQTATGQITGTVRDATGAVMPGVKVVVTNQQTGLTRETKTGSNGDYVIPLLPVGVYVVSGEQTGFKTAVLSDVALTVDQIQRVDMLLAPGNVTETVEVQSTASALDTGSASVGHTITEKQVTELPLNGRNFLQLLFLGAGAVETGGEQGGMRQGVGNAISIMGARPTSNNFMIDGTANIDTSLGTPAAVLSVDAIQEFKEQTTTYSAEYGFSSNQINLVSKTGHEQLPRHRLRVLQERWLGREKLLRRQDLSGAGAGSEAVRVRRRRPGDAARVRRAEPHVLPRQLRGDADRPRRDELLHRADAGAAGGTLQHADHRSGDRRAVPEQHHPAVALLAARAAGDPEQLVPGAEHVGRRRATTRRSARSRRCRTSSRSAATRIWRSSAACSSGIRRPPTRTRPPGT